MNVAVILCAGSGSRFDKHKPKQLHDLNGRPVLSYSLRTFSDNHVIDAIVVVTKKEIIDDTAKMAKQFKKVVGIVAGGERRQDSVYNGLKWIKGNIKACAFVFIHDSARPLVSTNLITKLYEDVLEKKAIIPIIDSEDTLKQVSNNLVEHTVDRSKIVRVQTPQVFNFDLILDAYNKFPKDVLASDDSYVVEYSGAKVFCVKGEKSNIKLTHPSDLELMEYYEKNRNRDRLR